jgi:hypothetical protein
MIRLIHTEASSIASPEMLDYSWWYDLVLSNIPKQYQQQADSSSSLTKRISQQIYLKRRNSEDPSLTDSNETIAAASLSTPSVVSSASFSSESSTILKNAAADDLNPQLPPKNVALIAPATSDAEDVRNALSVYENVGCALVRDIFGSCKFGQRFVFTLRNEPVAAVPPPASNGSSTIGSAAGNGIGVGVGVGVSEGSLVKGATRRPPPRRFEDISNADQDDDDEDNEEEFDHPRKPPNTSKPSSTPSSNTKSETKPLPQLKPFTTKTMLSIDLSGINESLTVSLLSLLSDTLGLSSASSSKPTFWAGGSPILSKKSLTSTTPTTSSHSNSSQQQQQQQQPKYRRTFTTLPHVLNVYFKRPLKPNSNSNPHGLTNGKAGPALWAPSVELPMDMDLGFAVDPKAPPLPRNKKRHTLYRLQYVFHHLLASTFFSYI